MNHYRGVFVSENRDRKNEILIVGGVGPRDGTRGGIFGAMPVGRGHPVLVDNAFAFGKVEEVTKNGKPALRVFFDAHEDNDLTGLVPAFEGYCVTRDPADPTIIQHSILSAIALVEVPDDTDSDLEVDYGDGVWVKV